MGIKWLSMWLNNDVKACLRILDQLDNELSENMAFKDPVKLIVRSKLLRNAKQVTKIIREKNRSYRDFVLFQTANVATSLVVSGNYHVYRGILSLIGQDFKKIFIYCIDELGKSGFYSTKEVSEAKTSVQQQIASVG